MITSLMIIKFNLHCLEDMLLIVMSKHLRVCVAFIVTCSKCMNLVTDIVDGVVK
jgi:hypothetical protein